MPRSIASVSLSRSRDSWFRTAFFSSWRQVASSALILFCARIWSYFSTILREACSLGDQLVDLGGQGEDPVEVVLVRLLAALFPHLAELAGQVVGVVGDAERQRQVAVFEGLRPRPSRRCGSCGIPCGGRS